MDEAETNRVRLAAQTMVEQQLEARGLDDPVVLGAMRSVPRHRFVPEEPIERAYADQALPTADGQTISQPYIVAYMTQLLRPRAGMKVLEIGTGSGYQAAVLLQIGVEVVTVERNQGLADRARAALEHVGFSTKHLTTAVGDGTLGYEPEAPYDAVLVTAAAPRLPEAYPRQLNDGGRIVIPIGTRHDQQMMLFEKRGERLGRTAGIGCRFVPLIGADGWPAG